ncbi:hypothetical protein [Streptomyces sp. NPDC048436]|uniref:hypothetical protein n=1 Tax=Streptomyces sp. NPDC048436 TaxID=3365550 RepID=UPI003711A6F2
MVDPDGWCHACGRLGTPRDSVLRRLATQAAMRALKSVAVDRMSIARIAAGPRVSWHTVNDVALATGHQPLIADPTRFGGVQVSGVDEQACRHTRSGEEFVTSKANPSRVFKTWLKAQTSAFRHGIEIVAISGFTGITRSSWSNSVAPSWLRGQIACSRGLDNLIGLDQLCAQ